MVLDRGRRGVVVAGSGADPVVAEIAAGAGWPVLGDPMSGARRAAAAVAHYDALLRDARVRRGARRPTSCSAWAICRPPSRCGHGWRGCRMPSTSRSRRRRAWSDPDATLARLLRGRLAALPTAEDGWLDAWRAADARVARCVRRRAGRRPRRAAGRAAAADRRCRPDATLVVASSMPVRDLESFAPVRPDPPRVLSNRGANGIDGTVSTAYGVASVSDGPVVLLIGDVALLHDAGGLLAGRRLGLDLDIVLLNNDGGGIFEFLPVAGEGDFFEEHVATPHGVDFAHLAAFYGCAHERAGRPRGRHRARSGAAGPRSSRCAPIARRTSRCTGARRRPRWRRSREAARVTGARAARRRHRAGGGCAVAIGLVALLERASVVGRDRARGARRGDLRRGGAGSRRTGASSPTRWPTRRPIPTASGARRPGGRSRARC